MRAFLTADSNFGIFESALAAWMHGFEPVLILSGAKAALWLENHFIERQLWQGLTGRELRPLLISDLPDQEQRNWPACSYQLHLEEDDICISTDLGLARLFFNSGLLALHPIGALFDFEAIQAEDPQLAIPFSRLLPEKESLQKSFDDLHELLYQLGFETIYKRPDFCNVKGTRLEFFAALAKDKFKRRIYLSRDYRRWTGFIVFLAQLLSAEAFIDQFENDFRAQVTQNEIELAQLLFPQGQGQFKVGHLTSTNAQAHIEFQTGDLYVGAVRSLLRDAHLYGAGWLTQNATNLGIGVNVALSMGEKHKKLSNFLNPVALLGKVEELERKRNSAGGWAEERFSWDVQALWSGFGNLNKMLRMRDDTPALYRHPAVGFENLPLYQTARHVMTEMGKLPHWVDGEDVNLHDLSLSALTDVPKLLENPVLIAKSPTDDRVQVLLNAHDENGLPLMAVLDKNGLVSSTIRANIMVTTFGLYKPIQRINSYYENEELIYVNQFLMKNLAKTLKLWLPRQFQLVDGFVDEADSDF